MDPCNYLHNWKLLASSVLKRSRQPKAIRRELLNSHFSSRSEDTEETYRTVSPNKRLCTWIKANIQNLSVGRDINNVVLFAISINEVKDKTPEKISTR